MKIATWNVNGIRARQAELQEFIDREQPDVLCLQEIKASTRSASDVALRARGLLVLLARRQRATPASALHVRKAAFPDRPDVQHPEFDYEHRIVTARLPRVHRSRRSTCRTAGRTSPPRCGSSRRSTAFAAEHEPPQRPLVLCGDFNVARTDMDVHPKERKPNIIGQRPDERALLERIIGHGLVDVHRKMEPENADLFTWWAPWRNMRQRNIGWRLDLVLASGAIADKTPSRASCNVSSGRAITGRSSPSSTCNSHPARCRVTMILMQLLSIAFTLIVLVLTSAGSSSAQSASTRAVGPVTAAVRIDLFSDFQCPACKALHEQTVKRIKEEYAKQGKVRLAHHDFPLPQHKFARQAATLAAAADKLGKFDAVADALFRSKTPGARPVTSMLRSTAF